MKFILLPLLAVTLITPRITLAQSGFVTTTEEVREESPRSENYSFSTQDTDILAESLNEISRNPEVKAAPSVRWERGQLDMNIHGGTSGKNALLTLKRRMYWTERKAVDDFKEETRDILTPTTCFNLICSGKMGDSALWNEFYNGKGSKVKALAAAIDGVGDASAEALIRNKYFTKKPKSWEAFAKELHDAGEAGVIQKSVVTMALQNKRKTNMAQLGYGEKSCREVSQSCSLWIPTKVRVPIVRFVDVPRERVVQTRTFDVNVKAMDAKLLPFESDHLSFSIDENGNVMADGDGGLNQYEIQTSKNRGQISIEARATSRKLRDLPSDAVRSQDLSVVNGRAKFTLDVNEAYIPGAEDPNAELQLNYKIQRCKTGYWGTCGMFSSWEDAGAGVVTLRNSRAEIDLDLPSGYKGQVVYSLKRDHSQYFNGRPTYERDTADIKIP